jgi:hypothetical protein
VCAGRRRFAGSVARAEYGNCQREGVNRGRDSRRTDLRGIACAPQRA